MPAMAEPESAMSAIRMIEESKGLSVAIILSAGHFVMKLERSNNTTHHSGKHPDGIQVGESSSFLI